MNAGISLSRSKMLMHGRLAGRGRELGSLPCNPLHLPYETRCTKGTASPTAPHVLPWWEAAPL